MVDPINTAISPAGRAACDDRPPAVLHITRHTMHGCTETLTQSIKLVFILPTMKGCKDESSTRVPRPEVEYGSLASEASLLPLGHLLPYIYRPVCTLLSVKFVAASTSPNDVHRLNLIYSPTKNLSPLVVRLVWQYADRWDHTSCLLGLDSTGRGELPGTRDVRVSSFRTRLQRVCPRLSSQRLIRCNATSQ